MKILTEYALPLSAVEEQARTWTGSRPTDCFSGDSLGVEQARSIGETLTLPGGSGGRVVACAFDEVLPRAADALLRTVEDCSASLFLACGNRLPETLRSRFQPSGEDIPTVLELYAVFSKISSQWTLDDVCSMFYFVPPDRVRRWYDQFTQSRSVVSQLLVDIVDGNVESSLRTSLGFTVDDLDLLYCELETQLTGSSLMGTSLSIIPRDKILEAVALADVDMTCSPSTVAAMICYGLL